MSTAVENKDSKYKARELEQMAIAMQCILTGIPTCAQLDIPKFAAEAGMTEASVKVTWGKIRNKLTANIPADAAAGPSTPSPAPKNTGKKTPKRKGETANGETPIKKSRANWKKKAVASGNEDAGMEQADDEAEVTGEVKVENPGYVEATKAAGQIGEQD